MQWLTAGDWVAAGFTGSAAVTRKSPRHERLLALLDRAYMRRDYERFAQLNRAWTTLVTEPTTGGQRT